MRLGYKTSGNEQVRKAKKEPLAEGIHRGPFSEQELETIRQTRQGLIRQGLTDSELSNPLSRMLQRSRSSILEKVRSMLKSGELAENPNKREYSGFAQEELTAISRRRFELIRQGLTDHGISKCLSNELQRSVGSIHTKLRSMVKSGKLPENPNKRKTSDYSSKNLETIRQKRHLLIQHGLTDNEIAKSLSAELHRPAKCIASKIHSMLQSGELPENPNKRETSDFSPQELETIRQKRPELIRQGLTDSELSNSLSRMLQRSKSSIQEKVRKMVKSGELPPNPNKMERFIPEELFLISLIRPQLIEQGLTDRAISKSLSAELQRPARSIAYKIRSMTQSGTLPKNPNKQRKNIPDDELLSQLKEAVDLYTEVSE